MGKLRRLIAQQLEFDHNATVLGEHPAGPPGAEEETGMSWVNTSLDCELQVVVRVSLHRQAYLQNS